MSGEFNSSLLRIARQARGRSQADLSAVSGVSQANISKSENGIIEPSGDVVEKLADALRFPISYFYQTDRIFGLPISVHPMYRKRSSVGQRGLERLEAELNIRLMHIRRLLKATEFEGEAPLPRLDPDEHGGDPEHIADLVRRTWLLPSGPVENLIECVERAGCLVVHCDFSDLSVDGITVHAPGSPPCIFLNNVQPGDRQRFTLAHELAHIVMHQVPSPTMEDEANTFASAFLMPSKDIRPYLTGRLTIQRLASLKPLWRASMQALLYRAKTVGAISDNQSKYLWRQISRLGYRRQEPQELDIPQEQPTVLPEILRIHIEDLGYGISELCSALHSTEEDLKRIHPLPGQPIASHLRLVE